jgi:hypothetical protein
VATCSCGHLLVLSCHAHEAAHAKAGSELDCLGVPRHSSSASTFLVLGIHLSRPPHPPFSSSASTFLTTVLRGCVFACVFGDRDTPLRW